MQVIIDGVRYVPDTKPSGAEVVDEECRAMILQFCATLTLSETIGEVLECCDAALNKIGLEWEFDDKYELRDLLAAEGATTLYGTSIGDDDE